MFAELPSLLAQGGRNRVLFIKDFCSATIATCVAVPLVGKQPRNCYRHGKV